jgi:hypothetical protein
VFLMHETGGGYSQSLRQQKRAVAALHHTLQAVPRPQQSWVFQHPRTATAGCRITGAETLKPFRVQNRAMANWFRSW